MEREVFAKNAHFIGGVLIVDRKEMVMGLRLQTRETQKGSKNPCSNQDVSKSEHGYILSILITLANRVSNAGFSPKIVVIPTP